MRLICNVGLTVYNYVLIFLFIFVKLFIILIQLKMTKLCQNVLVYYCIV